MPTPLANAELSKAIATWWDDNDINTEIGSDRIREQKMDDGVDPPYVILDLSEGGNVTGRSRQADGDTGKTRREHETRVIFQCWDRGKAESGDMATLLLQKFEEFGIPVLAHADAAFYYFRYFDDFPFRDDDNRWAWALVMETKFWTIGIT